jgi:hypothetical protein
VLTNIDEIWTLLSYGIISFSDGSLKSSIDL